MTACNRSTPNVFLLLLSLLQLIQNAQSFHSPTLVTRTQTSTKDMSLSSVTTATVSAASASSSPSPIKVAVIGAGAAGLVTARVLLRNGITPTIFEKDSEIGGVWSYHRNSTTRPMYRGLRTNLPRELMAYREFPWGGDGKSQSFVTHDDVKDYLTSYAKKFGVDGLIQYNSRVKQLKVLINEESNANPSWPKIKLEWDTESPGKGEAQSSLDSFDAVCICNGHYAAAATPIIPGTEHFQGKAYHSMEYDEPSVFEGQTVLCVGGRASGADLAREISLHAKKVYLSDTTCPDLSERNGEPLQEGNVSWVPRTTAVNADSTISFGPTCSEMPHVDTIIFCSGYDYQFPFINEESNLNLSAVTGERRIKPLFEQLWHAQYPSLAFVGLQHSVVPFPFFELQAEAIVSQIEAGSRDSGGWTLPPLEERLKAAKTQAESGGPKQPGRIQETHFLGSHQWDECLKYAKFAGVHDENVANYIELNKRIYDHSGEQRKKLFPGGADSYRYNSYVRDDENQTFQVYPVKEEIKV